MFVFAGKHSAFPSFRCFGGLCTTTPHFAPLSTTYGVIIIYFEGNFKRFRKKIIENFRPFFCAICTRMHKKANIEKKSTHVKRFRRLSRWWIFPFFVYRAPLNTALTNVYNYRLYFFGICVMIYSELLFFERGLSCSDTYVYTVPSLSCDRMNITAHCIADFAAPWANAQVNAHA